MKTKTQTQKKPRAEDATPVETAAAKPEPKAKAPVLSDALKTEANRIIAKREAKKAGRKEKREPKERQEDLVVFAFRLTPAERESIHAFAGPAKASRFVRSLTVAASRGDAGAVAQLLKGGGTAS